MKDHFRKLAQNIAIWTGSPAAFGMAVSGILFWAFLGPTFHYSDTWQLVINTTTTVITFLMVFLIQNTQNRDARAIHLKLDELIRATATARNQLIDLENLSDAELDKLHGEFCITQKQTEETIQKLAKHRERKKKSRIENKMS
ncbi:MAG: low affinity iron permease family protein [Pseudobdellovibrionaceae bacterium]